MWHIVFTVGAVLIGNRETHQMIKSITTKVTKAQRDAVNAGKWNKLIANINSPSIKTDYIVHEGVRYIFTRNDDDTFTLRCK